MMHEMITELAQHEVLDRAKAFFLERVPHYGAYLEKEGPNFATFRGQGGEEVTVAAFPLSNGTRVRASSLLYNQAIDRLFSILPPVADQEDGA